MKSISIIFLLYFMKEYAVMLVVGIALAAVAIRGSRRNKKDDD